VLVYSLVDGSLAFELRAADLGVKTQPAHRRSDVQAGRFDAAARF